MVCNSFAYALPDHLNVPTRIRPDITKVGVLHKLFYRLTHTRFSIISF